MRLVRFMSAAEAIKLLQGYDVRNKTVHRESGQDSSSVGFCFALTKAEIYSAAAILSGITIMHICLVAEVDEPPLRFVRTYGRYKGGPLPEISTTRYSLRDFDKWAFYAPHDLSGLVPAFSGNWKKPKLITKGSRR